jgi:hypothetical protein
MFLSPVVTMWVTYRNFKYVIIWHSIDVFWYDDKIKPRFLGAFSKLRKATICFVMSVCLSVCLHGTTRLPLDVFIVADVKYARVSASIPTVNTLILLTWRIWWAPNNASKGQMGFNSAFKGLHLKFECFSKTYGEFWRFLKYPKRIKGALHEYQYTFFW